MLKEGLFKDKVSVTPRDVVLNRGVNDNFRCGVGETIELKIPAEQLPMGAWEIEAGGGILTPGEPGAATYKCPDVPIGQTESQVWLKFGRVVRVRLDIVAPNSGDVELISNIHKHSDLHTALNRLNAGFFGRLILGPAEVSFKGIYFREWDGRYDARDAFSNLNGVDHPKGQTWGEADSTRDVTAQGTVFGIDEIWTAVNPGTVFDPNAPEELIGYADWPIRWHYNMSNSVAEDGRQFAIVHHQSWAYKNGRVCVRKGTAYHWTQSIDPMKYTHPRADLQGLNLRGQWINV